MRHSERMTAYLGAALVLGAIVATMWICIDHGARAVAAPEHSDAVPSDLSSAVLHSCMYTVRTVIGVGSMRVADDGSVVAAEGSDELTRARDAEEQLAACVGRYDFEPLTGDAAAFSLSPAARMVAYDYAQRWMLPCLDGHHRPQDRVPLAGYLDAERYPWLDYYDTSSPDDVDRMLDARRDCGSGYEAVMRG